MKRILFLLPVFSILQLQAQIGGGCIITCPVDTGSNLVVNPSFEQFSQCPVSISEMDATGWSAPSAGTSDYYNTCAASGSDVDIPFNMTGYQQAATGNAYVGIHCFIDPSGTNYREYIQGSMIAPMVVGTTYMISFKVSLANNETFANNKLGADLSVNPYNFSSTFGPLTMITPEIYTNTVITDTANWVTICDTMTADSAYSWITIGNFWDDAGTTTQPVTPGGSASILSLGSYYLLDDVFVCVLLNGGCDSTVINPPPPLLVSDLTVPNVFTPNGDNNNDLFVVTNANLKTYHIEIYDRWGALVFKSDDPGNHWDGRSTSGKKCVDGTYYYIIKATADDHNYDLAGFLTLIRD